MKFKIRYGTYETNSSAVHTLQISKEGLAPSELKIEEDGYIYVPLRYWGKERREYTSQIDKLSYICTRAWAANSSYYNDLDLNEEHDYVIGNIEEAIVDYTGAVGIKLYIPDDDDDDDYPGFDHQEYPDYSDDMNGFCNVYDESSIQNFVFNRYISFTTDCD